MANAHDLLMAQRAAMMGLKSTVPSWDSYARQDKMFLQLDGIFNAVANGVPVHDASVSAPYDLVTKTQIGSFIVVPLFVFGDDSFTPSELTNNCRFRSPRNASERFQVVSGDNTIEGVFDSFRSLGRVGFGYGNGTLLYFSHDTIGWRLFIDGSTRFSDIPGIDPDARHTFAMRKSNGIIDFFIDGVKVAGDYQFATTYTQSDVFSIAYNIPLSSIRVVSVALTDAEIAANANIDKERFDFA